MVGRIAPQPGVHGRAWSTVGEDGRLEVDLVELVRVDVPFITPVETAVGTHRTRPLVLVHLVCRRSDGAVVEGWGECAALADTTYDGEDAAASFATLRSELLPALVGLTRDGGSLPPVSGLGAILDTASRPLASATVEMAVGDAHLRAAGRSFTDVLGVSDRRVEPGAVLGLPRSAEELSAALATLTVAGYARVKVKVGSGLRSPDRRGRASECRLVAHAPGRRQRHLRRRRRLRLHRARRPGACLHRAAPRPGRPRRTPSPRRGAGHAHLPGRESRLAVIGGRGRRSPAPARWCASSRPASGGSAPRSTSSPGAPKPECSGGSGGCSSRAMPAG